MTMKMDIFWITLMFCALNFSVFCKDEDLISVATIFRHGDRTPLSFLNSDKYKQNESTIWPEGAGHLTNKGKLRQYELGKWFRKTYEGFIPEKYDSNFIHVMSSDLDRCLMSASLVLAGLFPPNNEQVWNKNISWQPIPVHTRPPMDDAFIAGGKYCKKFERLIEEMKVGDMYPAFLKDSEKLREYVAEQTGDKISYPEDIAVLHDNLYIQSDYNLTLPSWIDKVYPNYTQRALLFTFYMTVSSPELSRLKNGPLIDYIGTFFDNVIAEPNNTQKFLMLSGHDSTMFTLLRTLGLNPDSRPEYASSFVMELRKKENVTFVNTFYKNSTHNMPLKFAGCGDLNCPYANFTKIIAPYRLNMTVWEEECADKKKTEKITKPSASHD